MQTVMLGRQTGQCGGRQPPTTGPAWRSLQRPLSNAKEWKASKQVREMLCTAQRPSDVSARAATLEQPTATQAPHQANGHQTERFSWTKQWYPLAVVKDLDPSRPHAEMLLGRKLVLWRDRDEQWRCFEDECPHRRVPLSEGRIEESNGTLMCGYHGWTFDGNGLPANIPQIKIRDPQAEQAARSNPRACARVRPTQVRQGLVFVWGESGSDAERESAAADVPISSYREKIGNEYVAGYDQYVRDLPGGFEVWLENMQDQSHVPWAHHGVSGSRGGEKEGFFEMLEVDTKLVEPAEKGAAFMLRFDWSGNGKTMQKGTRLFYKPPCLINFWTGNEGLSLYIYAVPLAVNRTRMIINAGGPFKQKKPLINFLQGISFFANIFRVLPHIQLNAVNDGDIVFMSGQHRALGRTASQPADTKYFLPSDSDRGTSVWVDWLKTKGNGGPLYPQDSNSLIGDSFWDDSGKLKRVEVLDRYTQHTSRCTACSKALAQVRAAQKAGLVALGALSVTAATFLGQGQVPWSLPVLATAALGAIVALVLQKVKAFERQMNFTDWSQADLK